MPPILEPPKPIVPKQVARSTLARRVSAILTRLLILVAILIFGSSGWYLAKRGFGRQWRYRVVEELHKRGVEASVGRLTLDPFRGLIAQNVRIFDYKERQSGRRLAGESSERENVLAVVSEI